MDANTGEVVIKNTIDSLRQLVGHENLFTLTFIAKEVDQDSKSDSNGRLTARKIDSSNSELEHLIDGGLNADSDLPNEAADAHNHFIVNDNFYDNYENYQNENLDNNRIKFIRPYSSSLTSDLLAVDSNRINDRLENNNNNKQRVDDLASLQSINQMILNRTPLKSTPINVPPINQATSSLFRRRMVLLNEEASQSKPSINLTTTNLTNELNRIELLKSDQINFRTINMPSTTIASTSKPNSSSIKPFFVTSKPMKIKSTTTTSKPTTATSIKNKNSSSQIRNVNLVNDNLVADEHYIVNNLTSIGLMDEFRPENLLEQAESNSAEINRLNNERAIAMNAVLNELSGTSRTESEISIGFIILQISNHIPEFPLIKPNYTANMDLIQTMYGQIEENAKANTLIQFEQELLIQDQDHGLNGTFDVQLLDQTKTFEIQPKTGYRNQTFQISLRNSNRLRLIESKQINLKVSLISLKRLEEEDKF